MPWPDQLTPESMARVALVATDACGREVLVATADAGVFEPDLPVAAESGMLEAFAASLDVDVDTTTPRLVPDRRDPEVLLAAERADLLLGEAELERIVTAAVRTDRCFVLTGWLRRTDLAALAGRLRPLGGAVVELPAPRGVVPPTVHGGGELARSLRPLVSTYATVPYRDVDPVWFAGLAYVLMFGMMFGDVAHGAALVLLGLVVRWSSAPRLDRLDPAVPFLVGAGTSAVLFGFLYGEAFGPTGLVPTLWIRPLDEPEVFLLTGLVVGSVLLAITFVLSALNRWREGGPRLALYAASGVAGAALFAGAAAFVGGLAGSIPWLTTSGLLLTLVGAVLVFVGLVVGAGSGASAVAQAVVELFDTLLRLGSNVISFTRLAAFGLTHAVITGVVWDGTVALWGVSGPIGIVGAGVLFVAGNVVAFALGALVAAIQALRLEYYELFSRLFAEEGRPFRPWHLPVERSEPT